MASFTIDPSATWHTKYVSSLPDFVEFRIGQFGMSGFATKLISPETTLLSIPYDHILSEKYAVETFIGKKVFDALRARGSIPTPSRMALYIIMIAEKFGPPAMFTEYLQSLPESYNDPLWWTEKEMRLLAATNLFHAVRHKREQLQSVLEIVTRDCATALPAWLLSQCTFSNLLWAHSAFSSRAFPHKLSSAAAHDGEDYIGCLLPVLDILNHRYRTPISWVKGSESLSFVTHTQIHAGEEIYNNYGAKSNEELLMGYGFTLQDNPHDTLIMNLKNSAGESTPVVFRRKTESIDSIPVDFYTIVCNMYPSIRDACQNKPFAEWPQFFRHELTRELLKTFIQRYETCQNTLREYSSHCITSERIRNGCEYIRGQAHVILDCISQLMMNVLPRAHSFTPLKTSCDEKPSDTLGTSLKHSIHDDTDLLSLKHSKHEDTDALASSNAAGRVLFFSQLVRRHPRLAEAMESIADPDNAFFAQQVCMSCCLAAECRDEHSPWKRLLDEVSAGYSDENMNTLLTSLASTESGDFKAVANDGCESERDLLHRYSSEIVEKYAEMTEDLLAEYSGIRPTLKKNAGLIKGFSPGEYCRWRRFVDACGCEFRHSIDSGVQLFIPLHVLSESRNTTSKDVVSAFNALVHSTNTSAIRMHSSGHVDVCHPAAESSDLVTSDGVEISAIAGSSLSTLVPWDKLQSCKVDKWIQYILNRGEDGTWESECLESMGVSLAALRYLPLFAYKTISPPSDA